MTDKCCNYLNSWPWSTWPTDRFRRCSCHAWLSCMSQIMAG